MMMRRRVNADPGRPSARAVAVAVALVFMSCIGVGREEVRRVEIPWAGGSGVARAREYASAQATAQMCSFAQARFPTLKAEKCERLSLGWQVFEGQGGSRVFVVARVADDGTVPAASELADFMAARIQGDLRPD